MAWYGMALLAFGSEGNIGLEDGCGMRYMCLGLNAEIHRSGYRRNLGYPVVIGVNTALAQR